MTTQQEYKPRKAQPRSQRYIVHTLNMVVCMAIAAWMTAHPGSMTLYWTACSTLVMVAVWHLWEALKLV